MDDHLSQDSGARFKKLNKTSILGRCPLFAGLSSWELKSVASLMRLVEFRRDEIVYKEGEAGHSFYVVVSGRFEAYLIRENNKRRILAYLRHGDHFGEMSLLTQEPHSAAVKAISDSLVLELKKADFDHLLKHNAAISLELSRRLSRRLRGHNSHAKTLLKSDIVAVFSHKPKNQRAAFSTNLAASLFHETRQKTILLDLGLESENWPPHIGNAPKVPLTRFHDMESLLHESFVQYRVSHAAGFDILRVSKPDGAQVEDGLIVSILNHLAVDYRYIVIDLPEKTDNLTTKALTQAEFVFIVTDSHLTSVTETQEIISWMEKSLPVEDSRVAVVIQEVFFGVRTTNIVRNELFGRRRCYTLPALPWSVGGEDASSPLVVSDGDHEYSRVVRHIARFVSNNLVGLALGSGAALGLAHIGVLKVLEREKIPIDYIAGSSIGALIGSVYAINQNADKLEKIAMEINIRLLVTKLIDFSIYPIRGLLNGKEVMKHFGRYLNGQTFENCRIPFKCTGVNLNTREVMVFDSGLLADAVRASIGIPAVFKPVIIGGDTVIDGGILDPLPIRILHEAGVHKVIAINVFPSSKDMMEKRIVLEESQMREAQSIRTKMWLVRAAHAIKKAVDRCFFPNILDILMNTIQHMESEIAEIEGESADVLLRPTLPNANWVEFYKPAQFIRRGEEEAVKLLPKIKSLVAHQNT